jgi:putative tricarboxylic transport membrane protein
MESLSGLLYGFSVLITPLNLLGCFIGVFLGTLVGVLPGLGPAASIAILLPVTFKMPAVTSIIMLAGIYYGAMYGGSTTSILLNIPGEAASVITCLDGYQMARHGRAGPALGISAFGSFIAGTLGVVALMLVSPAIVSVALLFGSPEFVGLLLMGLTMVAFLSRKDRFQALLMAIVGLILGTVGTDPVFGIQRFSFGITTLYNGVGLIPVVMGLFGIAEVLTNLETGVEQEVYHTQLKGLLPNLKDWKDSAKPILRGSGIGFFLGTLPGMGAMIPTFISYAVEKRCSRTPERFGSGMIEGVAGPEAANNAASEGGFVPLLTLGIPANVVMAMMLGALIIQGITPGPTLLSEHPDVFWGLIASMYLGNVMLLVLNLPLIAIWVWFLRIPYGILSPLIILFCTIGAYSVEGNAGDVLVLMIFGSLGYLMRKVNLEATPLILGFILGPMLEVNFRLSLLFSKGSFAIFLNRPIALGFLIVAALLLFSALFSSWLGQIVRRGQKKRNPDLDSLQV